MTEPLETPEDHWNTWNLDDEERERLREEIMRRWREGESIIQPPSRT